jgi:hypothetical protein
MTVKAMVWLTLPDIAVTVAVYVPDGVPVVVVVFVGLFPPQPMPNAKASTINGAARLGRRFRLRSNRHPEHSNMAVHIIGFAPGGNSPFEVSAQVRPARCADRGLKRSIPVAQQNPLPSKTSNVPVPCSRMSGIPSPLKSATAKGSPPTAVPVVKVPSPFPRSIVPS